MKYEIRESDVKNVLEVVMAYNRENYYEELLNIILDKMMFMANADAGTLYIVEDNKLHFMVVRNNTLKTYQDANHKINLPPILLDKDNITNISAYAAIKDELISVDDVYTDELFNFSGPKNYDKLTGYKTESMLVFPLSTSGQEVIGVIQLINALDKATGKVTSFKNTCDFALLSAITSIASNTLANVIFTKEIDELFHSFVSVMTKAIDERSAYSVNHTKNVARFCSNFAEFLSKKFPSGHEFYFNENRRGQLTMAAYLHDIGKIITPLSIMDKSDRLGDRFEIVKLKFEIKRHQLTDNDALAELVDALDLVKTANAAELLSDEICEEIEKLSQLTYKDANGKTVPLLTADEMECLLVKKGTLTDAERKIMQEHVSITKRLLESMKFNKSYKNVANWAVGHHEFLDGTGYAEGLKKDEIPLEMCIITIADIFDALVASDRPYKKAVPLNEACEILREMADEGKLHTELLNLFLESKVWENEK
jgi:HD-GYP domain-containing protein (c-di-GMP phosphodiesterase class II)